MSGTKGGGAFWIGFVVVLLAAVVVTNLVLMRVASGDPSVAVEPDAYRKASRWDDESRERMLSDRLGWKLTAQARVDAEGAPALIVVRLSDASGAPVTGASVDAEAFAVARAGDRMMVTGVTDAAGVASLPLPSGRAGLWELRLRARRGDDAFVSTQRLDMAAGSAR